MQINALIDHGQVKLLEPLQLKHEKVNIQLIIPDNEIVQSSESVENKKEKVKDTSNEYAELSPQIQQMMNDIDVILNQPIDDSDIPELTEEQQQRIDAFSYREEFKSE